MNKIFAFLRSVSDRLAFKPWTVLLVFVAAVIAVETVRRL